MKKKLLVPTSSFNFIKKRLISKRIIASCDLKWYNYIGEYNEKSTFMYYGWGRY